MMNILGASVSAEFFLMVFLCFLIIVYFAYKEWPEFKKRMSGAAESVVKSESEAKTVDGRLMRLEKRVDDVYEMLSRDYRRLNDIEKITLGNANAIRDSLKERQIIMDALRGCLKGLQELGADGVTKNAIDAIDRYLNQQAHVNQELNRELK